MDLPALLDARERRAARQTELLTRHRLPLISVTMNIPGPVKRTPLIDLAFDVLLKKLPPAVEKHVTKEATGCEAILVCDDDAAVLKDLCVAIEEAAPVGRLYDLDVIDVTGEKLARSRPRTCLVCGRDAFPCARSRAHSVAELTAAVNALLTDFAADYLADIAVNALITEVELTPKPGLVDKNNSGAHRDMDLPLFYRSAEALRPWFSAAVKLGITTSDCADALRRVGIDAEAAMLAATGGVNTHKGVIYSFGLLLCALGQRLSGGGDVFDAVSVLAKGCHRDAPPVGTHGSAVKAKYGAGGARQEAMAGFPTARYGYDLYRTSGDLFTVFLSLLARCDDTNLLHRGGEAGLFYVKSEAKRILSADKACRDAMLFALDAALIAKNLSPGGSADLLALVVLMDGTRGIWENQ